MTTYHRDFREHCISYIAIALPECMAHPWCTVRLHPSQKTMALLFSPSASSQMAHVKSSDEQKETEKAHLTMRLSDLATIQKSFPKLCYPIQHLPSPYPLHRRWDWGSRLGCRDSQGREGSGARGRRREKKRKQSWHDGRMKRTSDGRSGG